MLSRAVFAAPCRSILVETSIPNTSLNGDAIRRPKVPGPQARTSSLKYKPHVVSIGPGGGAAVGLKAAPIDISEHMTGRPNSTR